MAKSTKTTTPTFTLGLGTCVGTTAATLVKKVNALCATLKGNHTPGSATNAKAYNVKKLNGFVTSDGTLVKELFENPSARTIKAFVKVASTPNKRPAGVPKAAFNWSVKHGPAYEKARGVSDLKEAKKLHTPDAYKAWGAFAYKVTKPTKAKATTRKSTPTEGSPKLDAKTRKALESVGALNTPIREDGHHVVLDIGDADARVSVKCVTVGDLFACALHERARADNASATVAEPTESTNDVIVPIDLTL